MNLQISGPFYHQYNDTLIEKIFVGTTNVTIWYVMSITIFQSDE